MDFYAIKFFATSALTGETFIGYIFGKKRQEPEFNIATLSKRKLKEYEIPDTTQEYVKFKSDIDILTYQITRDKNLDPINKQFNAYFYTTLKKYGLEIISTKFFLGVQDADPFVIKAIIQDILFDWGGETEVKLVAQSYNYEDLTWLQAAKKEGSSGVYEYLNRADVLTAQEIFPVIDPLDGFPVIRLDVGDPLLAIEIDEKNETRETIPGNLISKELIPGTNYIFLKIDLENGKIGKTVIQKNLKITIDKAKLENARQKRESMMNDEDKNKVIGDVAKDFKNNREDMPSKLSSFDAILIVSFSIIGILTIILIGIWLGAF